MWILSKKYTTYTTKGNSVYGHSCQTFNHNTVPLSKDHYHLLFQIWIERPDWNPGFPYKYMWLEHKTALFCDLSSTIHAFSHLNGSWKLEWNKKFIDYTAYLDLKKKKNDTSIMFNLKKAYFNIIRLKLG